MPITLLDILLLVVMLISGLLAMIRGFMREVLSIAAWARRGGGDALCSIPGCCRSRRPTSPATSSPTGVVIGGVFLVTLLIVSIITVRISDMILDSRIGALDRTLGFLFGLGRGLIIVVVAFLFFAWLVPDRKPAGVGPQRQVARRAAKHRRMADVHVAGRPRKHHLEAVEEARRPDEPNAPPDAAPGPARRSDLQPARRSQPSADPQARTDTRTCGQYDRAPRTKTARAAGRARTSGMHFDLERRPAARGMRRVRHLRPSRRRRHHRARPARAPASRPGGRRHRLLRRQALPLRAPPGPRRRQLLPPRGDRPPARHDPPSAMCAIRPPARPSCATCSRCSPSSTPAASRSATTAT